MAGAAGKATLQDSDVTKGIIHGSAGDGPVRTTPIFSELHAGCPRHHGLWSTPRDEGPGGGYRRAALMPIGTTMKPTIRFSLGIAKESWLFVSGKRDPVPPHVRPVRFGLLIGILLFPLFSLLDRVVYPEHFLPLLLVRASITVYLIVAYRMLNRLQKEALCPVVHSALLLSFVAISLMCFITGDGYASPYYAGLLQVIIVSSLFFTLSPTIFMWLISLGVLQHFLLMSLLPFEWKDLALNLFGLGVIGVISIVIHRFIFCLVQEIEHLKGIIPICCHCKKVRDSDGAWQQIESFIGKRTDAHFSHGICPECSRVIYPKLSP
jgi:hypothetical protein